MKDKRFTIAVLVIVALGIALLYLTVISPKIQGYVISKETQAQESTVQAILEIVDRQGYIAIGDGESSVVLVQYQPPADGQVPAQGTEQGQEQVELVETN